MKKYNVQVQFWGKGNIGSVADFEHRFTVCAKNSQHCKKKTDDYVKQTLTSLTKEGFRLNPKVNITKNIK